MTNIYLLETVKKKKICILKCQGKSKQILKSMFAKFGWNDFTILLGKHMMLRKLQLIVASFVSPHFNILVKKSFCLNKEIPGNT